MRQRLLLRREEGISRSPRLSLRSQAGQSILEVALLLPLLLLLVVGVIDVGRYMYIGILVGSAARAGAAYGSVNPGDTTGIQTAADNDFQNNGQKVSALSVTSTQTCGCDNSGTIGTLHSGATYCDNVPSSDMSACTGHWTAMINVTASGTFRALFSYPGVPGSITVSRTATMRVQN